MLIERIEPVDKKRKLIQLDSGESFVLYVGEIRLLRLEENKELKPEIYDRILKTVLPKRAKLRVMNLLKTRPYTEYQLTKKLKDGGYPDEVILIAIEYVKSYGYVNDKQYAIDYIRSQAKNRSKKELYMKLQQKGIQRETLDAAFYETYGSYKDASEGESFDEEAVIIKALTKKGFTGNETYEERQKLLAYFYRRGFSMDTVFRAMDALTECD